jgi:hypothetical protein
MRSLIVIASVSLVLSVATQAGYAEHQFMSPEQRECLNELLHSVDHRSLITLGAKIDKISFEKGAGPFVHVTVAYDKNENMITRSCTPPTLDY